MFYAFRIHPWPPPSAPASPQPHRLPASGGARTALFSWAYARRHGGQFIPAHRGHRCGPPTPEAVQAILDGMNWLDLGWDEGPFYQMQRMDRYKAVIQEMLAPAPPTPATCRPEELDALREAQRARGEKPRYDGRWRPEPGKVLPEPPTGVAPVIRFKNPTDGVVAWDDLVKGRIEIANAELDDLIIARADGTPTYNFCVVVDDWDMGITQVIRGDDHVNNTPRQINILKALGAVVPQYAHLSMILGDDGQKLSKRHGAVSVTSTTTTATCPRPSSTTWPAWAGATATTRSSAAPSWWSGSTSTTSPPSAAQFNTESSTGLTPITSSRATMRPLAADVSRRLARRGVDPEAGPSLEAIIGLYKDRVATLNELADAAEGFYIDLHPAPELVAQHLTDAARAACATCAASSKGGVGEGRDLGGDQGTCAEHGMKMPRWRSRCGCCCWGRRRRRRSMGWWR